MINEPKLLFADEPTGALNRKNTLEVLNLLTELNRLGQSILMVTHDMKAALRATRILYLEDGKVIGELSLPPYDPEEEKSRETQVSAWLESDLAEEVYDGLEDNENVAHFRVEDSLVTHSYNINGEEFKNANAFNMLKWNAQYKVFNEASNGFVTEPVAGAYFIGIKHFFISDEDFARIKADKLDQAKDSHLSMSEFKKALNETTKIIDKAFLTEATKTLAGYTTIFNNVGAGILYAFIIILFVIVVVIICHSISSGIEMDYTNLGILKANGLKNKKIRMIYILQYVIAQFLGILLGIVVAYPLTVVLGQLYLPITGILISGGISILKIAGILFGMMAIVCLFVFVLTAKVGKISPVRAISGGAEQIYFDSHMRMQIHKKALSLTLAFRQFTSNKKHYLGTLIISGVLVFFMMSMGLLANCMSSERFMESFGQIPMDLEVYFDKDYANSEMDHVIEDVEKIGSIKEYIAMGSDYVTLNGTSIWCGYYKNLSGIEKSVSKGRAPKYDNEIVITEIVAEEYDLAIGDEVTISTKEGEDTYMVSGFYQSTMDTGMCIAMNSDAYKKIGTKTTRYLCVGDCENGLYKKLFERTDRYWYL